MSNHGRSTTCGCQKLALQGFLGLTYEMELKFNQAKSKIGPDFLTKKVCLGAIYFTKFYKKKIIVTLGALFKSLIYTSKDFKFIK